MIAVASGCADNAWFGVATFNYRDPREIKTVKLLTSNRVEYFHEGGVCYTVYVRKGDVGRAKAILRQGNVENGGSVYVYADGDIYPYD